MSLEKEIAQTKIKCRQRIGMWLLLVACCSALIGSQVLNHLEPFSQIPEFFNGMVREFQYGLIAGLMLIAIYHIVYNLRGTRNDDFARKIYVRENDERNKLVKEKSGVRFYLTNIICLCVAIVISGYYSYVVFSTLTIVTLVQAGIMLGSKIYWKAKL